ncbi:hypothetical protein MGAD_44860 [Mycolicibacterium gadium]|uniref:DUF732 domain-containing protein n=1 Tax=Mycolicibacterium gadium TaxID=1794 RepID=A0A7I7WUH0_MYCGU|nr:hypothetical protein MGAD_44860 [Mycolicibacterium gadium]
MFNRNDRRKLRFAEVDLVIRTISVVGALVGAAVLSAPSAAADEAAYLAKLQDRYAFLTPQQLLAVGERVCAAERAGVLSPGKTTMVINDLGVGNNTALEIVSAAEWELC